MAMNRNESKLQIIYEMITDLMESSQFTLNSEQADFRRKFCEQLCIHLCVGSWQ